MSGDFVGDVDEPDFGAVSDEHSLHRGDVIIARSEVGGQRYDGAASGHSHSG